MSNSLRPYGLQHARPPCSLPTPGVYPNSCPLSRWSHPTISSLSSPSPPAFNLFQHKVFSNESALRIRWPKYWSFSFSVSPSNEHPGLISIRVDWLDLLAVQGTLKSLLQHHSSKASILTRRTIRRAKSQTESWLKTLWCIKKPLRRLVWLNIEG